MNNLDLSFKRLGLVDYQGCLQQMQDCVELRCGAGARDVSATDCAEATPGDEVWFVEHPPVFTLGRRGGSNNLINPGDIPVVHTDRGGDITYHGPGQLVAYVILDLRRGGLGIRALVDSLQSWILTVLTHYGVSGELRPGAPGVYVDGQKIASVGLRVRRHWSYHGVSFNVDMDLEPFARINPCGYQDLSMTSLKALGVNESVEGVADVAQWLLQQQWSERCAA